MANVTRGITGATTGASVGSMAGPVGTVVGGVLGGLGGLFSGDDTSAEEAALQQALADLDKLPIPDAEKRVARMELLAQIGTLNPELEANIVQSDTELQKIVEDPIYKQKQQEVLANLITKTEQGLDASDLAARNAIVRETGREASSRNEAVLTGMARRGMLGSGAELASKLSNEQAQAERASIESEKLAATRAEAMRDALAKMGQFSTDVRGQEYGMAKDRSSAQDLINRYNTEASRDVQSRNVQAKNQAAAANLREAQRIADANKLNQYKNAQALADANTEVYNDKRARIGDKAKFATGAAVANREERKRGDESFATIGKGITEIAGNPAVTDFVERTVYGNSEDILKKAPVRGNR